jgi:arginine-tRNA-protein transferase
MPLHVAQPSLSDADFEIVLEAGLRRSGQFTYYTACENCQACEPVRIDANKFDWSDSWRRIINRGDRLLKLDIGPPEFSIERLQLFNIHRDIRNLGHGNDSYTPYDYQSFLVDSCCDSTYELRYYLDNSLVALSVIDLSSNSISARKWVYLGLYVAENQHLNYKARFLPQERYINRQWIEYSRPTEPKS